LIFRCDIDQVLKNRKRDLRFLISMLVASKGGLCLLVLLAASVSALPLEEGVSSELREGASPSPP